jgi:hypothetical protein
MLMHLFYALACSTAVECTCDVIHSLPLHVHKRSSQGMIKDKNITNQLRFNYRHTGRDAAAAAAAADDDDDESLMTMMMIIMSQQKQQHQEYAKLHAQFALEQASTGQMLCS